MSIQYHYMTEPIRIRILFFFFVKRKTKKSVSILIGYPGMLIEEFDCYNTPIETRIKC